MDVIIFLSRFIFHIRYKLIIGSALAVAFTWYFTNFLPRNYVVTTTIFTGITSKVTLDNMSGTTDWHSANNAHDNIINLTKSKSTLERIAINLVAQHLVYGDPNKDNNYISAEHYRQLMSLVAHRADVMVLVDKTSVERTVDNLTKYKTEDKGNFIYAILNWEHQHYSYIALHKIKTGRKGASDMIEMSYECNDPGIATHTIDLLNKELVLRYEGLMLSTSNDVVAHFKKELAAAAQRLSLAEDDLVVFNTDNGIINYEEQTKFLVSMNTDFESIYHVAMLENESSTALINALESQMETRTKLVRENEQFLIALNEVSTLNGQIAEIEIFGADAKGKLKIEERKRQLTQAENRIQLISDKIDIYKFSKEGVVITDIVNEWLTALLKQTKSKAELAVMDKRRKDIQQQYDIYSPVGPNLKRKERAVEVAEAEYLSILQHLNLAKLKQKNVLLDAGTLQVVTPPETPLLAMPRNRPIFVISAMIGAIVFIFGFYLMIELLDRTVRDGQRAKRLTGGAVCGAFPSNEKLKYRGFSQKIRQIATSYLANILNAYMRKDRATVINLLSINHGEGKSFIAKQLEEHWVDLGFSVTLLSYDGHFESESKQFIQTISYTDLLGDKKTDKSDIYIVEYAPLTQNAVPEKLLQEASINLFLIDARRVWLSSDSTLLNNLRKTVDPESLLVYLNNANHDAVEQYTGQLPPYTMFRRLSYNLFNFGLTAKRTNI